MLCFRFSRYEAYDSSEVFSISSNLALALVIGKPLSCNVRLNQFTILSTVVETQTYYNLVRLDEVGMF